MRRIIIKEGPLVFLRDVLLMELIAAVFFYVLSLITNYEQLFNQIGITRYIHYNDLLVIGFSLFQVSYVIALFLYWYSSYFEVNEKEIIQATGTLFRRRKMISLSTIISVEVSQPPIIGRFMPNHATLVLEHSFGGRTKMRNVTGYREYIDIIKYMIEHATGRPIESDVRLLLKHGEDQYLEFKETLRYDVRKGETSKEMEHAVLKTLASFMNTDGGTLLIGVNDVGEVQGLENDYKALPKKNRDGFENHLSMLIRTMIGLTFAKHMSVKFEQIDEKDLCVVMVRPSHKPAYLKTNDRREEFFVRVGNSTQPFTMSEAEEYISGKWK